MRRHYTFAPQPAARRVTLPLLLVFICAAPSAALAPDCASPPGQDAPTTSHFSSQVLFKPTSSRRGQGLELRDPAALAYDTRGDLYIADPRANRIFVLRQGGRLAVAAGNGKSGYRDGPAATARLNQPVGLALARDGSVYIADLGNHAVRVLMASGRVSTVARAGLETPSGVALDDLGNVFVADASAGARRINSAGHMSALSVGIQKPFAVASAGPARDNTLFFSGSDGLATFGTRDQKTVLFPAAYRGPDAQYLQGFRRIGRPGALAALDDHSLLYADVAAGTIRYIDMNQHLGRVVAFRPGLLDHPLGIAIRHDGKVAIGTRAGLIIQLAHLDLRKPIMPALEEPLPDIRANNGVYPIALMGASMLWWNTDWPDSLPGQLETAIGSTRIDSQKQPVHVYPILIPGGTIQAAEEYLATLGEARLIRMAMLHLTASMIGNSFEIAPQNLSANAAVWQASLARGIQTLKQQLGPYHVPLVVIAQPEEFELVGARSLSLERALVSVAAQDGVNLVDLYPAFTRALGAGEPVFGVCDKHLQAAGRRLAAAEIANYVRRLLY